MMTALFSVVKIDHRIVTRVFLQEGFPSRSLSLGVRRPDATPDYPVRVRVHTSAETLHVVLQSADWKYVTVHLRPTMLTWLRSGQRIDLSVTPWFVPALLDPTSSDLRRMGVQLRVPA